MSKSTSSKRGLSSAFDLAESLEQEDHKAAKLRRKQSTKDVARAKAARSQTKIYSHLMETRILLQRGFQQVSQLDLDEKEESTTTSTSKTPVVEQCDNLLEQLIEARRSLMGHHNKSQEKEGNTHDNDESTLQSEYETCRDHWKEVLNRRHQDLRLHAGLTANSKTQFKSLDSSFWQQVEATVAHEELRQRSSRAASDASMNDDFDDSKVYQQMLKEFVLASSSNADNTNGNNPSSLSQRWKSPHTKKQVDRKASKGRKIRYIEIPKLVNFCFPVSKNRRWCKTNLTDDEWFSSLFGGAWTSEGNTYK